MKPKVFIAQMEIDTNLKKNLEKVKKFFHEAENEKCHFIIFPENFSGVLTPLSYKLNKLDPVRFVNSWLKELKQLSKKHKIYCIAGTLVEKRKEGFYKTSYLLGPRGKVIGKYDKISLTAPWETNSLQKGKELPIHDTSFGKIGIVICRDLMYPELVRELALKGAKIIFCPTFWEYDSTDRRENIKKKNLEVFLSVEMLDKPNPDRVVLNSVPVARAIENEVFVVVANAAGKHILPKWWGKLLGHSSICSPLFGNLVFAGHSQEQSIIGEMDFREIEESRKTASYLSEIPKIL